MTAVDEIRDDDNSHLHTIEQACIRFEAAWAQGQTPDLTEYLQELSGEAQRHALCELLWIEWDNLRRLGTTPSLAVYQLRFAELSDAVDEAWRSDFRRFATEDEVNQTRGGRYTILKSHARGGFGQVYVAQDEELGRQVALKEIQRRHAKSQVVQERFVREAKITGKLEHPGIVPVYSVGTKPDGTPFYAMRFVQGESLKAAIDEFHSRGDVALGDRVVAGSSPAIAPDSIPASDQIALAPSPSDDQAEGADAQVRPEPNSELDGHNGTRRQSFRSRPFRQLLSRFVYVCNVMEYAHSRGVLHRDLKPGNIMLGKHGETLVVDWGLAKEVGQPEPRGPSGTEGTSLTNMSFTTHGALIGTVCYMSPEQAAGKLGELTEASDIYSLGATLYHLLVGQAPLAKEPRDRLLTRIQRGDVPRAKSMQPAVPGPLDAICANAMSHDPADRYESAAALADDLEHWLADEAVVAYAEPRSARIARWARRHQTAMAGAIIATLIMALASATIAVLISFNNRQLLTATTYAEVKRIAAEEAQTKAEKARKEAVTERDLSKSIADFMVKCFRSPDPEAESNTKTTVAEILDRSFDALKGNAEIEPFAKVRFLEALADSNRGLGLYSRAVDVAEYALDYSQHHLEPDHEQLLVMQSTLAQAYLQDGQIIKAVARFEEVVRKTSELFGSDHEMTIARQVKLASAYLVATRIEEAFLIGQKTFDKAQQKLGPAHAQTIEAEHTLAVILMELGHFDAAITSFSKMHGIDHEYTLWSRNALASAYAEAGRHDEAISLHKEILELRKVRFGTQHPYTLNTQNNLANAYQLAGQYDEAIALHKTTFELRQTQLGKNHPSTFRSMSNLGNAYADAGVFVEAIPLLRRTLDAQLQYFGEDDIESLRTQRVFATALMRAGHLQQAISLLEQCLPKLEQKRGKRLEAVSSTKGILAQAYRQVGRAKDAVSIYRELLPIATDALGTNHPEILALRNNLATALTSAGHLDEAASIYEKTLALLVEKLGADNPRTLQTTVNLALCFQQMRKFEQSLPLLESARPRAINKLGWAHPITLQCHFALAEAYQKCKRQTDAAAIYESVITQLSKHLGPAHVDTVYAQKYFADYLFAQGQYSEAISRLKDAVETLRGTLGRENMKTLQVTRELAEALQLADRSAEADPYFHELVAIGRKRVGGDEVKHASNLYWLGMCQIKQEKYSDAEASLRECWTIRQRIVPGDWTTAVTENVIGLSIAGQKRFEEAEKHLITGFDAVQLLRDTIPPQDSERIVRQATERIVKLYELWDKPEQSETWRRKLPMQPVESVTTATAK